MALPKKERRVEVADEAGVVDTVEELKASTPTGRRRHPGLWSMADGELGDQRKSRRAWPGPSSVLRATPAGRALVCPVLKSSRPVRSE